MTAAIYYLPPSRTIQIRDAITKTRSLIAKYEAIQREAAEAIISLRYTLADLLEDETHE